MTTQGYRRLWARPAIDTRRAAHDHRRVTSSSRATLSVSIVCKNNEQTIGRTLDSVRGLADEIVAVDSGSTDGTLALLEAHGAKVFREPWRGYIETKRRALEHCTCDWVLSLDSDESLEPALQAAVRQAMETDTPAIGAYEINRKVFYAGRFLESVWQPEWRLRLVRRAWADWGGHEPHDKMKLKQGCGGRVARLRGDLRHDSFETIAEHLATQARHADAGARALAEMGQTTSAFRLLTSPPWAFVRQIVLKRGFMDGWRGWTAAASAAAGTLMKHAILLERTRRRPTQESRDKGPHAEAPTPPDNEP